MAFSRSQILEKLRAKVAAGQPLIMGGAGIGLVAKIMDRSGIDVIMSYNTGPFRMDGHGSLAGYLAYGAATQITIDLARRIVPMAPNTPVIGAFAKVLRMPPIESIVYAIREDVPGKIEDNIRAAEEAYREVRILDGDEKK